MFEIKISVTEHNWLLMTQFPRIFCRLHVTKWSAMADFKTSDECILLNIIKVVHLVQNLNYFHRG